MRKLVNLETIQTEKDKIQLREEFETLKETWNESIFGWDIEQTDKEIQDW